MGQSLFPLLRPAYENTPELATLASQVRADSESNGNLERQIEFDNKVARELSSLSLTGSQVNELKFMLSTSDLDMESKNLINTMNPEETDGQLHPSKAVIQAGGVEQEEEDEWGIGRPRRDASPTTCKVERYNVVESAILAANEFVY